MPSEICGAQAAKCVCLKPKGHEDDVHACDPEKCGGSWRGEMGVDFEPVTFPILGLF